jgi:hypothetical protein
MADVKSVAQPKKKLHYSLVTMQCDMPGRLRKFVQDSILSSVIDSARKAKVDSLAQLSLAVRSKLNAGFKKSVWHCIVGRDFSSNIRYRRKAFYYGRCESATASSPAHVGLEFMVFRSGPSKTSEGANGSPDKNAAEENQSKGNIDSEQVEKNKVVNVRSGLPKAMNRTLTDLVRLAASQKDGMADAHTTIGKFIKSRMEMMYCQPMNWHVIVGDSQALDGSVQCDNNYYAVMRVGNYKVVVFCHADDEKEPAWDAKTVTRGLFLVAAALFSMYIYLNRTSRQECARLEQPNQLCSADDIASANGSKENQTYLTMAVITLLIMGTTIRLHGRMKDGWS